MRFRTTAFLALLCSSFQPPTATAQEHCNALLTHGIRNEWSSVSQKEWNNLVFHRYCRKKDNSWSFSHDGQVGLQSVPLGIAGSWFGSQKDKDEFCQRQADQSQGKEMDAARLSLLSVDALQAWNQCQSLSDRKVELSIGDLDGELLGFSVRRTGNADVVLKTLTFNDGFARCSVDGEEASSGARIDIKVDVGQVNIRCARKRRVAPAPGVDAEYDRAEIGIDTNEGGLDLNLPPLRRFSPQTADEIRLALSLPQGAIIPWYWTAGDIPAGWAICDGANGTPDLRDRFLRGTVTIEEVGDAGGKASYEAGPARDDDIHHGYQFFIRGTRDVRSYEILPPYVKVVYIMKL